MSQEGGREGRGGGGGGEGEGEGRGGEGEGWDGSPPSHFGDIFLKLTVRSWCTHTFVHSSKTSFINYLPSNSVTLG